MTNARDRDMQGSDTHKRMRHIQGEGEYISFNPRCSIPIIIARKEHIPDNNAKNNSSW